MMNWLVTSHTCHIHCRAANDTREEELNLSVVPRVFSFQGYPQRLGVIGCRMQVRKRQVPAGSPAWLAAGVRAQTARSHPAGSHSAEHGWAGRSWEKHRESRQRSERNLSSF